MRVWADHVEVWNEGELPASYTPETILGQHSSRQRNKNIANACIVFMNSATHNPVFSCRF
ncbi:MAG: hypothetical protein K6B45_08625 [Bacteroidaceae bacterium]|nr:hypothetical protein [Bacteroidaceae bacterium]